MKLLSTETVLGLGGLLVAASLGFAQPATAGEVPESSDPI